MNYSIGIYKDKKGTILVIPYAHDENGIGRSFDKYGMIERPYETSDIGRIARNCFKECIKEPFLHSQNAVKVHTLATGIDNWAEFSRGKIYVSGSMCSETGFSFSQWKRYRGGAFGGEKGLKQFYFKAGFDATDTILGELILKAFDSPPIPGDDEETIIHSNLEDLQISNIDLTKLLVSISRIFILIRFKINEPYNTMLLLFVRNFILGKNYDFGAFKKEFEESIKLCDYFGLISIYEKDTFISVLKSFDFDKATDNVDEINKYFPIITECITEICFHISERNFDRAYDLIDVIHCLPEALLYKKKWNPRAYWRNYITRYRNKWDKNFLQKCEKEVVKAGLWAKFFI